MPNWKTKLSKLMLTSEFEVIQVDGRPKAPSGPVTFVINLFGDANDGNAYIFVMKDNSNLRTV
jgi:hypothetical protein